MKPKRNSFKDERPNPTWTNEFRPSNGPMSLGDNPDAFHVRRTSEGACNLRSMDNLKSHQRSLNESTSNMTMKLKNIFPVKSSNDSNNQDCSQSPIRKTCIKYGSGSVKGPNMKNQLDGLDHNSHISSMNSKDPVLDDEVE